MNDGQGEIKSEWISIEENPPETHISYIWAHFPICEPPYIGSQDDCDWNSTYDTWFTHYLEINNNFFYLDK